MGDTFDIDRFDFALRNWRSAEADPVSIGSDAHKRLFCRMLLETHNPYKPAVIAWPQLEQETLRRLTSLPIWDIAVQTEGRAAVRVQSFAQRVSDPLLRQALEMGALEEARHKQVLNRMVEAYGIHVAPEPPATAFAMFEAVFGQFYIAVVVAQLVGARMTGGVRQMPGSSTAFASVNRQSEGQG